MPFSSRHTDRLLSAASRVFVRFASKKQGGSTSNGRDSNPKFLGLKAGTGQVRVEAIQLSLPPKRSRDSDAEAECCCVTSPGRVASCVAELAFNSATRESNPRLVFSFTGPRPTHSVSLLPLCAACAAGQHPSAPARHQVPPGSRGWYGTHPSTLFSALCVLTGCSVVGNAWLQGKDHTLFALIQGTLRFKRSQVLGRKLLCLDPATAPASATATATA